MECYVTMHDACMASRACAWRIDSVAKEIRFFRSASSMRPVDKRMARSAKRRSSLISDVEAIPHFTIGLEEQEPIDYRLDISQHNVFWDARSRMIWLFAISLIKRMRLLIFSTACVCTRQKYSEMVAFNASMLALRLSDDDLYLECSPAYAA